MLLWCRAHSLLQWANICCHPNVIWHDFEFTHKNSLSTLPAKLKHYQRNLMGLVCAFARLHLTAWMKPCTKRYEACCLEKPHTHTTSTREPAHSLHFAPTFNAWEPWACWAQCNGRDTSPNSTAAPPCSTRTVSRYGSVIGARHGINHKCSMGPRRCGCCTMWSTHDYDTAVMKHSAPQCGHITSSLYKSPYGMGTKLAHTRTPH
jgi:hypothetical protein